ncbi:hypothetical protein TNCV_3403211 [Trichonephila clavipes]|nr:hypothetical protein TNCV_3403211 [Trichonephila clavipes]
MNKVLYADNLHRLHESIRKMRPKLWTEQYRVILQDNAPAHRSLLVTEFLKKIQATALPHPPYSPDLTP